MKDSQFVLLLKIVRRFYKDAIDKLEEIRCGVIDIETEVERLSKPVPKKPVVDPEALFNISMPVSAIRRMLDKPVLDSQELGKPFKVVIRPEESLDAREIVNRLYERAHLDGSILARDAAAVIVELLPAFTFTGGKQSEISRPDNAWVHSFLCDRLCAEARRRGPGSGAVDRVEWKAAQIIRALTAGH